METILPTCKIYEYEKVVLVSNYTWEKELLDKAEKILLDDKNIHLIYCNHDGIIFPPYDLITFEEKLLIPLSKNPNFLFKKEHLKLYELHSSDIKNFLIEIIKTGILYLC